MYISVQNNKFANLHTVVTGPPWASSSFIDQVGVYINMTDGNKYRLAVEPAVSGYGGTAMVCPNNFYGCKFGVYSKDYNIIKCEKSTMRCNQNFTTDGYSRYGFMLQSSSYEDVQVNSNTIYNVANGVAFTSAYGVPYPVVMPGGVVMYGLAYQNLGSLVINGNTIQAAAPGVAVPSTNEYVSFGIAVQNSLPAGTMSTPVGNVQTMGNYIKDVHRGILVQGYQTQQAYTGGNIIGVNKYGCEKSWGIDHANNYNDAVGANTVTATYSKNDLCLDSARSYIMELGSSSLVTCNSSSGTGRGFEFFHTNTNMFWAHNNMDMHNAGMYLNNASIGQQGYNYHPNDNIWNNPSWWSFGSKDHTFVLGSPGSIASVIFARSGIATDPSQNDAIPFFHRYLVDPPTPSLQATSGFYNMQICPVQEVTYPAMARAAHEQPILDAIDYDDYYDARLWISQLQVWEAVNHDHTLTDSSALLDEFKIRAGSSRFAYLSQAEQLLTSGNVTGAESLLGSTITSIDVNRSLNDIVS